MVSRQMAPYCQQDMASIVLGMRCNVLQLSLRLKLCSGKEHRLWKQKNLSSDSSTAPYQQLGDLWLITEPHLKKGTSLLTSLSCCGTN